MQARETSCWTMIQGAATGRAEDREQFALRYGPVIRTYLEARWGATPLAANVDDAVQDVFVECFKDGGALDRIDRVGPGSFRRFLHGVARNVARRFEERKAKSREAQASPDFDFNAIQKREETLSEIFDRAWARSLLKDAVAIMVDNAERGGEEARRRVEILHLRFYEDLPVREIAARWNVDAETIHVAFARARREFKAALQTLVEFQNPGSPEDAEKELEEIIALLS